jgi:signal transduction histidine kinase
MPDPGLERATPQRRSGEEHQSFFRRLRLQVSRLRAKLILPYVVLTLGVAFVGIFIVTRLVTSTVRERFVNQLYQAARVASDGEVRLEEDHLSSLRLMVFTVGVPDALVKGDAKTLSDLLYPLALNDGLDSVVALNDQGKEIMGLARSGPNAPFESTSGAEFGQYPFVAKAISGQTDPAGDKFTGVVNTSLGQILYTSAPVRTAGDQVAGVLLIGTRLDALVQDLKDQSLADVALLDTSGHVLSSSMMLPADSTTPLDLPGSASGTDTSQIKEVSLYGRTYQVVYAPWVVREEQLGSIAVVLPSNFVVSTEATSRNQFSLIFAGATLAVIILGYVLAQSIAGPILRLRTMAQAVAAGDLEQKSGLDRTDEIGDLAQAFDVMTARLQARTSEANRLYEETVERNRQLAEMYDRLQAAQQQLIQSEKLAAVGQLAAGIVHDVKNPLGVIKGMAEELMEDTSDDPGVRQGLLVIRDNANRANLIVTDLLKFARQSTPTMQKRDMRETLEGCLRLTDYLIRKGNVKVSTDFPADPVWITYDPQQIEQVVINLIQNAVQAMPEGGELETRMTDQGDEVLLEIADDGKGIEPENLSRIFEPFFTTKPEGQGTGMGLAVTYGIVSRHGGQIDVTSQVGQGTTFSIWLPKEPDEAVVGERASA